MFPGVPTPGRELVGRADVVELKRPGVAEILLQDTPPDAIVATVRRLVAERGPR